MGEGRVTEEAVAKERKSKSLEIKVIEKEEYVFSVCVTKGSEAEGEAIVRPGTKIMDK